MNSRNRFAFTPATKTALKARIALEGVSGSGKTWTALTIARGLVGPTGRIALADTERGKASLYDGVVTKFDTLRLTTFDPSILVDVLAAASEHDACIVDSFSHFWMGVDGMLEQVDRAAKHILDRDGLAWVDRYLPAAPAQPAQPRGCDCMLCDDTTRDRWPAPLPIGGAL